MLNSWRKRYLKGRAKRTKPVLKRRSVRVKETLYSYRDGIVRISVRPYQESVYIDLKKETWFWDRIKGVELGELILKEDILIVTVRKKMELKVENPMAFDINLLTLDGYDGEKDYSIDIKRIYTIHRVYELKRRRIQQLPNKHKIQQRLLQKYRAREKNRVNDILHKVAEQLADRTIISENLRDFKERIADTTSRTLNRQNSKHDYYIKLQRYVEYKAACGYLTTYVNPKLTSRTCSRCVCE